MNTKRCMIVLDRLGDSCSPGGRWWHAASLIALLVAQPLVAAELGEPGWQKSPLNPVLSLSDKRAFDSQNIMSPAIVKHQGKYFLYYAGGPSGPETKEELVDYQIGLA